MRCIKFKSGYKYQLKQDYEVEISIKPPSNIISEFITLDMEGVLTIKSGYAWDGPSGPTFDTLNFMRGSLVHDALYQLMREEHLSATLYRNQADRLLQYHCKKDGMFGLRAWIVYQGVKFGGGPSADPSNDKPLTFAPKNCTEIV